MKSTLLIPLLITLLMLGNAQAQLGPNSPSCKDCESLTHRTEPFNGTWYNPEQSGTGFSIDVQNGILFGVYYGYDDTGKPLWLTFVNDLVASEEPNIMWILDADLRAFKNGNSFNNDYIAPELSNYNGQIHIKFTQKNHAIFRVNNGREQNIVPIIFNMPTTVAFPEQTSYKFPELEGIWTFAYNYSDKHSGVRPEPANFWSETFLISKSIKGYWNDDDREDLIFGVSDFHLFPPEIVPVGEIVCYIQEEDGAIIGPTCEFVDQRGFLGDIENKLHFKMSIGGIGAFRIFGETVEGDTFEAIKFNSNKYNF